MRRLGTSGFRRLLVALLAPLLVSCGRLGSEEGRGDALAAEAEPPRSLAAEAEPPPSRPVEVEPAQSGTARISESRRNAIVQAASRVAPAVVTINVIRTRRVRRSVFDVYPSLRRAAGFGSGFVIDAEGGIVLTNEHVVRGADRIMVTLADGRDAEATLVGADEVIDVAVLRIEADSLREAPLGTSEGLVPGEWAIAIGNPFGTQVSNTEPTITAGVVSGVRRHIVPDEGAESGFYLGMIQTDAAINPGNSGGPLVNALGQVVGINSSIFSRGGGSEGLGFAIPIDRALRVAEDLLDHGEVRRPWLGFDVDWVEADDWGRTRGVRVGRVLPGSPAAEAGLTEGERLLRANARRLTTPLDFEDVLLDTRAGDEIVLEVEGRSAPIRLRATTYPSLRADRVTALRNLDLVTVTDVIRAERGLQVDFGALIVGISPELSAQLRLRTGDVVYSINRAPVRTAQALADFFERLEPGARFTIYYERNGRPGQVYLNYRGAP